MYPENSETRFKLGKDYLALEKALNKLDSEIDMLKFYYGAN